MSLSQILVDREAGQDRCPWQKPTKPRKPPTTAALALTLLTCLAATAATDAPSVSTTCAELSDDEADELASRLQLTLAAAKGTEAEMPRSVVVACDKKRAWVIWDLPPAEVLPVQPGRRFTESVIEAVEGRLQRVAPPPTPPAAIPAKPAPQAPAPTTLDAPAPVAAPSTAATPRPQVTRQFTHGGLSLGASVEILPEPFTPPLGGRFEVGVGVGLVSIILSESVRTGSGPAGETFGFDVGGGVAWGAPFDVRYNVGAKALIGVDWFESERASGVAELGLRGALYAGDYALWLGIDGRYRMGPQSFGSPVNVKLPHLSGLITVGGALLVKVSRRSGE